MKVPVTLGGGCAISDTHLMVFAVPDALPPDAAFTRIFDCNIEDPRLWGHSDWEETVVSTCLQRATPARPRAGCALSEDGTVEIGNSAGITYERIPGAGLEDGSRGLGRLAAINEIGGALHACGGWGQVYRRDEDGTWAAIDTGLADDEGEERMSDILDRLEAAAADPERLAGITADLARAPNLSAIDGTAADDLYVCGQDGQIFHFDGAGWTRCATPGASHLNALHCVSPDLVVAAGQDGALWTGNRAAGFTPVAARLGTQTFWSVRKFGNDIFAGSGSGLHRVGPAGHEVVVTAGLSFRSVIQQLSSFSDEALWIVGDRNVWRLAGNRYQLLRHPDN